MSQALDHHDGLRARPWRDVLERGDERLPVRRQGLHASVSGQGIGGTHLGDFESNGMELERL